MNEKYPLALPEGSVLAGQYIIEKVLGQGGFGITYEARDHKTGERVAVKEFFPDAMATRTNHTTVSAFSGERGESFAYGKSCFLQEAETLAKFIGNENIVRIHSYFEENGTAYFVMDFVEGTSFDEYLRERGGKIPFAEAVQILVPVMDALSVVHSQGIIHRDVTPDNIYITNEGVVKLLDFGAARYSLGDKSRSLDIILKHGFAPKEQYTRRGKQGPYTDVYALGATFYFALTGKRPPDSVERMDEDDLVPPSSLGVQISEAAEDAIMKALSIQTADRFQSMQDFKNALLNVPRSEAAQPAFAATGAAVSQTYFNASDQSGIPRTEAAVRPSAPEQAAPAAGKPEAGKKKLLPFIAGGAAVAVLALAIILGPFGKGTAHTPDPDPAPTEDATPTDPAPTDPLGGSIDFPIDLPTDGTFDTPTEEPSREPAPPATSTGSVALAGSTGFENIMNGGIFTIYNSTVYYIMEEGSRIIISNSDSSIVADEGAYFSNLTVVDGKLYILESTDIGRGYVSTYDVNTGKIEALDTLNTIFSNSISQVLMTEDYYFIGWSGDDTEVYRVSRRNLSDVKKCCVTDTKDGWFGGTFTLSDDGWLYYTARDSDGMSGIRRMRADTLEKDNARFIYNTNTNVVFGNPIIMGDYLYVSMYDSEGSYYSIIRMDREKGFYKDTDPIWVVSDELGTDIYPDICGFNVNANNGEIYFYLYSVDEDYPNLYRMTGYNDGTFDARLVSEDAFCPNLCYYSDGSYDVNHYYFSEDDESFSQYYFSYDSNGNVK